jgi:hypothetical protein
MHCHLLELHLFEMTDDDDKDDDEAVRLRQTVSENRHFLTSFRRDDKQPLFCRPKRCLSLGPLLSQNLLRIEPFRSHTRRREPDGFETRPDVLTVQNTKMFEQRLIVTTNRHHRQPLDVRGTLCKMLGRQGKRRVLLRRPSARL